MCRSAFVVLLAVIIVGGCATGGERSEPAARICARRLVLNQTWQWVGIIFYKC